MAKTTAAQRRELAKKSRLAREARVAEVAAALEADNEISVDDIEAAETGRQSFERATAPKTRAKAQAAPKSTASPRKPVRIAQPKADYEKPPARRKTDPDVQRRAEALGVVPNKPAARRVEPLVRRDVKRHPETGRVVVERGGRVFTRRTTNIGDKFHVDAADIPDGMSYQWIAVTVAGAEQRNSIAQFQQNGWESVPMSRHPGRYGPDRINGKLNDQPIVIDGLMLCERPIELTVEARGEEIEAARQLIRTRNEQFNPRLPEALSRRGTGL